ncbi:Hypothetical protein GLP15_3699 [Giardia lamblia P15]|uniref:Uncharacterized protein n=1 Tax=Giardia intestinalis (strain P15) TaxID=658858 RepID=E1F5T3_GIAIA|nr:Hypothetical protein GLP15_3699 [Giardia lamblia P15]
MDALMTRLFDPQKRDKAILDLLSSLSKDPPEEGMTPEDVWRAPGLSLIVIGLIAQSYRNMERVGDAAECLPQLQSLLDLLVILSSSKTVAESFIDSSLIIMLFPYFHLPHTPLSVQGSVLLVCANIAQLERGPSYLIEAEILPLILPLLAGRSSEGVYECCCVLLHSLVSAVADNPSEFSKVLPPDKLTTLTKLLIEVATRIRSEDGKDWLVPRSSVRPLMLTIAALKGLTKLKCSPDTFDRLRRLSGSIRDLDVDLSNILKMILSSE